MHTMHTKGVVARRRATDPWRKNENTVFPYVTCTLQATRHRAKAILRTALEHVLIHCSMHTENVAICAAQIRHFRCAESLAVCMSHMYKQCSNFYAKDLSPVAERQRLRCALALTRQFVSFPIYMYSTRILSDVNGRFTYEVLSGVYSQCPTHTESVGFAPHNNIYALVLNQRIVFPERRVESFAVCMPHMDKQYASF